MVMVMSMMFFFLFQGDDSKGRLHNVLYQNILKSPVMFFDIRSEETVFIPRICCFLSFDPCLREWWSEVGAYAWPTPNPMRAVWVGLKISVEFVFLGCFVSGKLKQVQKKSSFGGGESQLNRGHGMLIHDFFSESYSYFKSTFCSLVILQQY